GSGVPRDRAAPHGPRHLPALPHPVQLHAPAHRPDACGLPFLRRQGRAPGAAPVKGQEPAAAAPAMEQAVVLVTGTSSGIGREAAIAHVLGRHGRLDALVNNAGFGATLALEDTPPETLRAMLETNLVGAHDLARLALPAMRRQGHGRIVNVGSVAGQVAFPMIGAYSATKFALRGLTQALDCEVRR